MRFLLLIHSNEAAFDEVPEDEVSAMMQEYLDVTTAMEDAGVYVSSHRLRPTHTATSVRVRDGKVLTTDGPFAETKEALGGYYLIEVEDLDQALGWAARLPSVRFGCVEVRPVWPREEYVPGADASS